MRVRRRRKIEHYRQVQFSKAGFYRIAKSDVDHDPNAGCILREKPNAKIAVLYQNDDYGNDYLKGLKDGLGAKATSMIVVEQSYETTQPTIDSQIVKLKSSGADVFVNITIPKFAVQAISKMAEIEWKPLHVLNSISSSIGATIKSAGSDAAQNIISSAYISAEVGGGRGSLADSHRLDPPAPELGTVSHDVHRPD